MTRPRLLDLFAGIGGAGRGYQRAGFHVTGVDICPQPRYGGDEFHQADALEYLAEHGHEFDAFHASPPCQAFSAMRPNTGASRSHPNLIPATRDGLVGLGVPYVIENVRGAPLLGSLMLCGSMFGLRSERGYLQRHRFFESNVLIFPPGPCRHEGLAIGVYGHGTAGLADQKFRTAGAEEARLLMGMPWAHRDGLAQAIPPAYTEWIGGFLIRYLEAVAA